MRVSLHKDTMKFKSLVYKALVVRVECAYISCEISLIKAQLRLRKFSSPVFSSVVVTFLS